MDTLLFDTNTRGLTGYEAHVSWTFDTVASANIFRLGVWDPNYWNLKTEYVSRALQSLVELVRAVRFQRLCNASGIVRATLFHDPLTWW